MFDMITPAAFPDIGSKLLPILQHVVGHQNTDVHVQLFFLTSIYKLRWIF